MYHLSQSKAIILVVPPDRPSQAKVLEWLAQGKHTTPEALSANPNLRWFNQEEETLKIEDVRALIEELAYTGYRQEDRFFVLLKAETASIPAQNALLKSLEEPPPGTWIILVTTAPDKLLPTIHSRCLVVATESTVTRQAPSARTSERYDSLAQSTYTDLIAQADQYKDRDEALQLIRDLQTLVHSRIQKAASATGSTQTLPVLLQHLQILSETYRRLEANGNVLLCLESCFFALKQSTQKRS